MMVTMEWLPLHYYFKKFNIETLQLADLNSMENQYNYTLNNLTGLFKTYQLLGDDESKEVFLHSIKGKLTNKLSDFKFAPEAQYWLKGFYPTEGDIVIDGGAFDAGTSVDFAMQGAKVYAFEMDETNYQNCLARAEKYKFTIENMGLSSEESEESYIQGGVGSHKGIGNKIAHFIDIDTYVKQNDLPRIDYIKLDIEGAELDCLKGAAKSIVRYKPKMAISAYHKPEDLWTLAEYVHSLRPDYEFAFRHYKIDVHDYILNKNQRDTLVKIGLELFVPSACEMVLYCK